METDQSVEKKLWGTALIQPELTSGISRSDINIVSQDEIETLEVSSCGSQMKPGEEKREK